MSNFSAFLDAMRGHENTRLVKAQGETISAQSAEIAATRRIVEAKDITIEAHERTIRAKDAEIETLRSLVRHLELSQARLMHPATPRNG